MTLNIIRKESPFYEAAHQHWKSIFEKGVGQLNMDKYDVEGGGEISVTILLEHFFSFREKF